MRGNMLTVSGALICLCFLVDYSLSQVNRHVTFTVMENEKVGATIGKVSCDATNPQYSLDHPSFVIRNDGRIQVAMYLDREAVSSYKFDVTVLKGATLACTIPVTVQVQDVNDNAPVFTSDYYHLELPHHYAAGAVIGNVKAMDFDIGLNGQVTYSFPVSNSVYAIDANTGRVSIKNPSLVSPTDLDITVVAKDRGTPSLSSSSIIHIMPPGSHNMPMK